MNTKSAGISFASINESSSGTGCVHNKQYNTKKSCMPDIDCPKAPKLKPRNTNFFGFIDISDA